MSNARKTIFISYAHEDRKWVDELIKTLAPWIRDKRVKLWDDSQISAGSEWLPTIQNALNEATVAVLFVTKDFLASEFIMNHELPILLDLAKDKKIRLAWIAVGHSSYKATKLAHFQAVNDPEKPLESLNKPHRNRVLVQIAKTIADAAIIKSFATSLNIIDETTEPIEAILEGHPEKVDREFHVQAKYEPEKDRVSFIGATETITFEDLKRLPEEDQEFIADYEDSLKRNYERWRLVRKGLGDAGGALDSEIQNQLDRIVKLICSDLNNILNFLEKMHKYELDDHYGRYRYLCEKLK